MTMTFIIVVVLDWCTKFNYCCRPIDIPKHEQWTICCLVVQYSEKRCTVHSTLKITMLSCCLPAVVCCSICTSLLQQLVGRTFDVDRMWSSRIRPLTIRRSQMMCTLMEQLHVHWLSFYSRGMFFKIRCFGARHSYWSLHYIHGLCVTAVVCCLRSLQSLCAAFTASWAALDDDPWWRHTALRCL